MNTSNKIALVTGGSRGLGKNMALALAGRGIDLVLTYNTNQQAADNVAAEIRRLGRKATALRLDTSDVGSFESFAQQLNAYLSATYGSPNLDFLINNAGTALYALVTETTEAQMDAIFNIHYKGVFFLTQKLLPILSEGGGIVNISSGLTRLTMPGSSVYASLKTAVETLSRYMAKELGPRKIRVNVVAPGAIETDFGGGRVRDNKDINDQIAGITALGRAGLPDDIGGVVAFLCTEDARWINAQRIEVSGGQDFNDIFTSTMNTIRIRSITEFHRFHQLPPPEHPLISVVDYAKVVAGKKDQPPYAIVADYYSISVKRGISGKMLYGQQEYDFDEGVMYFLAPGQVLRASPQHTAGTQPSGWIMLIHPDFLWQTALVSSIRHYAFFGYAVNEALFLSEREEATINAIIANIVHEYRSNIDKFSQGIIIAQISTLLNYAERFYQRQFITRKVANHQLLDKLEALLNSYFKGEDDAAHGLPTVQHLADALHMSPNYLSSLLKTLTGQNTQQHIHGKLIERAKERLSTTELSVSEIAYELGFEHPQSFSKLFKAKTNQSPLQFRASFN